MLYETKAAMVAPSPGRMPTSVPTPDPRAMNLFNPLGMRSRLTFVIAEAFCTMLVAPVSLSISVTENIPMSTGMKATPSNRSRTPMV